MKIVRGEFMNTHVCPHCGDNGISGFRKQFLGPALPAKCSKCGGRVGVSYWRALVSSVPWLLAIVALPVLKQNGMLSFCLGAVGAGAMMVLWNSIVPLEKR